MRIVKLGKGLKPGEDVFGEGSGPPQGSCAAGGLQTPTGGASSSHLPTDNAAQNPRVLGGCGSRSSYSPGSGSKRKGKQVY